MSGRPGFSFFTLTAVQQSEILTVWLEFKDIGNFDSAICNDLTRADYLSLIQTNCNFEEFIVESPDNTMSEWILDRHASCKSLSLQGPKVGSFTRILHALGPSLRKLQLQYYPPNVEHEEDEWGDFSEHKEKIMTLELSMKKECFNLTRFEAGFIHPSFVMNSVITQNVKLEEIVLKYCFLSMPFVANDCATKPGLKLLSIKGSTFDEIDNDSSGLIACDTENLSVRELHIHHTNLAMPSVTHFCSRFPNLIHLLLGPISTHMLITIAARCVHMQTATVWLCATITDTQMVSLADSWKDIEVLQLQHHNSLEVVCSETAVLTLLQLCPLLQKLKVCISDATSLNADADELTHTPLRPVHRSTAPSSSSQVTELFLDSASESTLRSMVALCPYLTTLAIRHCTAVEVSRENALLMNETTRPAEFALHHLAACQHLRALHLANFTSLDEVGLCALPNLQELVICDVYDLDNPGVESIARACPQLRTVKLYRCMSVDARVVLVLLQACARLQCLHFCSTYNYEDITPPKMVMHDLVKTMFPNVIDFDVN